MISDDDAARLYGINRAINEVKEALGTETNAAMDDMLWLIDKWKETQVLANRYHQALEQIDCHIRSTPYPVPHIVDTLKRTLPEYKEAK